MPNDKRAFPRFEYPADGRTASSDLLVSLPDLSDEPIHPMDFSTGGFRINLERQPKEGSIHPCSIKIFEINLTGLTGRIARVYESGPGSSQCSVGLSINITEEERDHLASLLTRFLTEDAGID